MRLNDTIRDMLYMHVGNNIGVTELIDRAQSNIPVKSDRAQSNIPVKSDRAHGHVTQYCDMFIGKYLRFLVVLLLVLVLSKHTTVSSSPKLISLVAVKETNIRSRQPNVQD